MDTAITIVQVFLAILFAGAGLGKLTQPYDKLAARMAWVNDFKPNVIRGIGGLEALAAVGIIAPLLIHAVTSLTAMAAEGLALVMAGAVVTHLRRGEYPNLVVNLVLLSLALLVAYGRLVGW